MRERLTGAALAYGGLLFWSVVGLEFRTGAFAFLLTVTLLLRWGLRRV